MPIPQPEDRIDTEIAGKYRLERILGQGGFGTVYAGSHSWTGRPIAVKLMDPILARKEEYAARFLQEAQLAARLSHPNVVDVLDMGRDAEGTVYLVLEYLEGEDLAKVLKREHSLTPEQTFTYLLPVMEALAEAHAAGIVHRDLKPGNIFLSVDKRGRTTPKLLDFGIAKDTTAALSMTRTGQVWGTPHFMSPEQASGARDVGPSSDVWSMGVVLYRCLSGKMPFTADSPGALMMKVMSEAAPLLERTAPHVPREVSDAIGGALEQELRHRYPDMGRFLDALVAAIRKTAELPPEIERMLERRDAVSSETLLGVDARTSEDPIPRAPAAPLVTAPDAGPVTTDEGFRGTPTAREGGGAGTAGPTTPGKRSGGAAAQKVADGPSTSQEPAARSARASVTRAEPAHMYRASLAPTDPDPDAVAETLLGDTAAIEAAQPTAPRPWEPPEERSGPPRWVWGVGLAVAAVITFGLGALAVVALGDPTPTTPPGTQLGSAPDEARAPPEPSPPEPETETPTISAGADRPEEAIEPRPEGDETLAEPEPASPDDGAEPGATPPSEEEEAASEPARPGRAGRRTGRRSVRIQPRPLSPSPSPRPIWDPE